MNSLWQDIRFAARMLWKNKGVTVIAIITLALGIGANTAIFSVVNAALLRPLPFENPNELVQIWGTQPQLDTAPMSPANFLDWRNQNRVFERIVAYTSRSFNLSGSGEPERIRATRVTDGLFELLGARPALGRAFLREEDQPGGNKVVILSHALWQRRFNANPEIVGQTLMLSDQAYMVVGVMPPSFAFPNARMEMWTPMAFSPAEQATRDTNFLSVIARLRRGVSLEQARSNMETLARAQQEQYPASNAGIGVKLVSLNDQIIGDARPVLYLLLGAVGFVLLIACANVANLLLARAASRRKEMAVRAALGASRWRVVRQLLTESVVLALLGGGLGLLLAFWMLDLLVALQPTNIPRLTEVGIDRGALFFTLAISLLTGVVFGLAPSLQASNPDLSEALKEGGRSATAGAGRQRMRSALVVVEVALSLALLIGAGLMIKSFVRLLQVDPGFSPENVLTMELALPIARYADAPQQTAFFQQTLERVGNLPGVESASVTTDIPLYGGNSTSFSVEGRPPPASGQRPLTEYRSVSHDYFRAMGISLLKGRAFTERDATGATGVVIINETLARRFFPDEDPVGRRIGLSGPPDWREIVGVVRDARNYGLDEEVRPEAFIPYLQNTPGYLAGAASSMNLVVRTASSDPLSMTAAVKAQVHAIDRDQPVYNVKTMEQYLADSLARRRFNMMLLTVFAGVALLLAAIGIYGVMNHSVTQRTHEVGIRIALGAGRGDVLRMIVGQGMILTLLGVALGLAASFALTRLLAGLLYGVSATDPLTFVAIPLVLSAVALAATYIPARRATKIDPMVALRYE